MNKFLRNSLIAVFALLCGTVFGQDSDGSEKEGNVFSQFEIKSGTITESEDGNQVIFDFNGVATAIIEIKGHFVFEFENKLCKSCVGSVTFPDETDDTILMLAKMATEQQGYSDVKVEGKTLSGDMTKDFLGVSKITIMSILHLIVSPEENEGVGTLEAPLSPDMANVIAGALEKDAVTDYDVFIKGKIASIKNEFSANYGTAVFFISADGKNDFTFQCYSVYYLENKSWVEGNTQIKVGDEVVICGKLTNFKGNTPETAQKQAYIYSLNGVTKNEGGSVEMKEASVAEALSVIDALEDGKTTEEAYMVKGFVVGTPDFQRKDDGSLYGNVNLTIADEKGGSNVLTVFRAKSYENEVFTEETIDLLKEGDEVVFAGYLQKYVNKSGEMTPELTKGYVYSINGKTSGIQNINTKQADGVIYNLAGQRVEKATKGIFIQNGKKFVVK